MNRLLGFPAARLLGMAALLCMASSPVLAFAPQTIVVDGVNDFLLTNRVEDDSGDTEHSTLDLLEVYITNDANKLYVGFGHDPGAWTTIQDGITISTVNNNGATTDMWTHAISFSGAHTPGFGAYVNHDNNWQEFRVWTGSAWSAPLRQGAGANGMIASTNFHEISFLLCELGITPGDSLWFEVIITQDGTTKGPLDVSANDAVQLSTPGGTTFDTQVAIDLPLTIGYLVQDAGDTTEPTVLSACKSSPFTISVEFDEAVDLTTGQNAANYALGGTGAFIVSATRQTAQCNVVDLALGFDIGAQVGLYSVTVTNVEDLSGNVIVANNTTNRAEFFLKDILIRGLFSFYLQNNSSPPDTFSVEGNLAPLTFTATCDTGIMADADNDSIYEVDLEFCIEKHPDSTYATKPLEWKFLHNCTTFEPLAGNREYVLSSETGPTDTLEAFWGDQDPSQFLAAPLDVVFAVDMSAVIAKAGGPFLAAGDTVAIAGSSLPLSWGLPSDNELLDDGVAPDTAAGDKIYTTRLRFPIGTTKNVDYKFAWNSALECSDSLNVQGNHTVFLNDAAYDTLGGTLGELELPVALWDFCTITSKDIKVVWQLKTDPLTWPGTHVTSVGVRGEALPLSWDTDHSLLDDGVPPDVTGSDGTYSGELIFPQGSSRNIAWKYTVNGVFENSFNRDLFLNDQLFDVATPIVFCDTLDTDVTVDTPPGTVGRKMVLRQNTPNPFNPMTRIVFEIAKPGKHTLTVYDVSGRQVRRLFDKELPVGFDSALWNGLDDSGTHVGSGIYFYVLEDERGTRESRKAVLMK